MPTALDMTPGAEFLATLRHCWESGEAVFVIDHRLGDDVQDQMIRGFGVTKIVSDSGVSHLSRSDTSELYEPGDALIMATSGTSGPPKGVVLTHDAIRASSRMTMDAIGRKQDDHWLCCIPPSHIGGFSVIARAIHNDLALTVLPGFEAAAVTDAARNGANLVSLVNTALRRIDPSLFRKILLGGSAPLEDRPTNTIATYGMTETASGVVYDGTPLDGVDIRVDDDSQIWVRTPTLFRCYTDGTSPVAADGWFPTGDAGAFSDNQLQVFGRLRDVVITGGEKVWPAEVEAALCNHRGVTGAIVHGEPDPEWDERVIATIEVAPGSTRPSEGELSDLVKTHVATYAAPKEYRFVERLPRTSSGKVLRPPAT